VQGSYPQKCERKKVKDAVVQEEFVNNLNKVLSILGPIDRRIVKYQSDKVPISEVLLDFFTLPNEFGAVMRANSINNDEYQYLVNLAPQSSEFMYGTA
jgi:hypothetical protein